MSSANHSQPMQTYCGRVARKPRPDDRFLDFRVAFHVGYGADPAAAAWPASGRSVR